MKDSYSLSNIKKIKWGVLEPNQPISLYPIMYPGWCGAIAGTGDYLGMYQKNSICLHIKDKGLIFIDHDEWNKLGEFSLNKVTKNPGWGLNLIKIILKKSNGLTNFTTNKILKVNLKTKSNRELYKLYDNYLIWQSEVYNPSLTPVYLDLYKPHLTSYLVEYLRKQIKKTKYSKTAKECFSLLTIPEKFSKVQEEEINLLKIASKINNKKFTKKTLPSDIVKQVENHIKKYKYMGYNFEGPAFPDSYFWQKLKKEASDDIKPLTKINKLKKEKLQTKKDHQQLIKDLKIDTKHQKLFDITQGFIYSKDYRKMSLVQSYYELEPLLLEIGKRIKLSLAEIRNCLLSEVKDMLDGKLKRPGDLTKRMKGCLFIVVDGILPGRVYVDKTFTEMKKYLEQKEDLSEINYFHGQTACLGQARGKVKIINTIKDLSKMKPGDILISTMTNPDLVPAMKKAAAIVTDLGGITCHAAIVSRELKIPCVIGTKVATEVLKDGDEIIVDASNGEIRKIK